MKIKTSTTPKTAPAPPPSPGPLPAPVPGPVPASRRRARCCSTWTCCDHVLLFILILGVVTALAGAAVYISIDRKNVEYPSYLPSTEYSRGKCRVEGIFDKGPVCCAGNGNDQCTAGVNGDYDMDTPDERQWCKFKDEATNDRASRDMMEEWEAIEEAEREERVRLDEDADEEGVKDDYGYGYDDDDDDDDDEEEEEYDTLERKKRSGGTRNKNKSFACYQIWLSWTWDNPLGGGSNEELDNSTDEWIDTIEEQRRRRLMELKRENEERMRKEEDPGPEMMDPNPEWKSVLSEPQYKPEGGIVWLSDAVEEDGSVQARFYDSETTKKHYAQCSYSACIGKRCQSTVDIEEKMRKWRARMDNGWEFDCSVSSGAYIYETWENNLPTHRFVLKMILPFTAFMITVFVCFIIRRVRRCKLRGEQCRSFRAANMAIAQEKYAVPPVETPEPEKTMTKEEEANLPPSAPPMVLTIPASVPLPPYGKDPEMPPEYKSTADLKEAWTKMEADEEKKKPSDSEA